MPLGLYPCDAGVSAAWRDWHILAMATAGCNATICNKGSPNLDAAVISFSLLSRGKLLSILYTSLYIVFSVLKSDSLKLLEAEPKFCFQPSPG